MKARRRPSRTTPAPADVGFALVALVLVTWGLRSFRSEVRPGVRPAAAPAPAPAVPGVVPSTGEVEAGRIRRARADLERLKEAMLAYRAHKGELPPLGDYCGACWGYKDGKLVMDWSRLRPEDPRVHMDALEEALRKSDGMPWFGPYLDGPIPVDPWGREYTYDDNDPAGANAGDSKLFSAGPDRCYGTEDDVVLMVLSEKDGRLPLKEWVRLRERP